MNIFTLFKKTSALQFVLALSCILIGSAIKAQGEYRDEFSSVNYNNNDGTMTWNGLWIETSNGSDNPSSPSSGEIQIVNMKLRLSDDGAQIYRGADLSGTGGCGATLTFDYSTEASGSWGKNCTTSGRQDPNTTAPRMELSFSKDGGNTWTWIKSYFEDPTGTFESVDIDPMYLVSGFAVRFAPYNCGGTGDASLVDNVDIAFNPDAIDIEVGKTVDKNSAAMGDQVTYTLTAKNNSCLTTAMNIVINDALPGCVSFVSSAGDGFYNGSQWTIPSIGPGATATQTVTVDVTGPEGSACTNTAMLSTVNGSPGDAVASNDVSSATFNITYDLNQACQDAQNCAETANFTISNLYGSSFSSSEIGGQKVQYTVNTCSTGPVVITAQITNNTNLSNSTIASQSDPTSSAGAFSTMKLRMDDGSCSDDGNSSFGHLLQGDQLIFTLDFSVPVQVNKVRLFDIDAANDPQCNANYQCGHTGDGARRRFQDRVEVDANNNGASNQVCIERASGPNVPTSGTNAINNTHDHDLEFGTFGSGAFVQAGYDNTGTECSHQISDSDADGWADVSTVGLLTQMNFTYVAGPDESTPYQQQMHVLANWTICCPNQLLGNIFGNVTEDLNNDGTGDQGIGGTTVTLLPDANMDGIPDSQTPVLIDLDGDGMVDDPAVITTNPDGSYHFPDVPLGSYVVQESDPIGFQSVSDSDDLVDGATDGDINTNPNDNLLPVSLVEGEKDTEVNFVDIQLGFVSGSVKDDTGAPLSGVTVQLVDPVTMAPVLIDSDGDGMVDDVATVVTGPDGSYAFPGVPPGDYNIVETDPTGLTSVSDNDNIVDGPNDGEINNGNPNDNTIPVSITGGGESDTGNDFVDKAPLPILGLSFDASQVGNTIVINWSTLVEINNDRFDLMHSVDGIHFTEISSFEGSKNSIAKTDYQYTHKTPVKGANYYQLNQYDLDGTMTESNILLVRFDGSIVSQLIMYPTAAKDHIIVESTRSIIKPIDIQIWSANGKFVKQLTLDQTKTRLDISSFAKGLYYVSVIGDENNVMKFVKL